MIAKLVIGRFRGLANEIAGQTNEHPHAIRKWVEHMHREDRTPWTVCTFSPTVIRAVIYTWDKDPLTFSRIVLRSDSGKDTPLLDIKSPAWLAHFSIEDLYMNGEFDQWLRGSA